MSLLTILILGDIVGNRGRHAVEKHLFRIVDQENIDFVIANGENAGPRLVLTREAAIGLLNAGIDLITGGNHTMKDLELVRYLAKEPRLLRPYNYPDTTPGSGSTVSVCEGVRIGVVNLQGQVFMNEVENSFLAADRALAELRGECELTIVDFHAEATSEKVALGHYLDGRVTAVLGTHTHIQTADAKILPGGTAYLTDLGMTGPVDSVIGVKKEIAVARFVTGKRKKLEVAGGQVSLEGAVIKADSETGLARQIKTLHVEVDV